MPYAANHLEVMGVRVSPNEAKLLEWARPEVVQYYKDMPDAQSRIYRAKLLQQDIERVADWKARHGC